MFAVIKTGGKQYRVAPGDTLRVETLEGEKGSVLQLSNVLLVDNGGDIKVGAPTVEGASVTAEIISHGRAKKIIVFKHKRRKSYRKKNGHRQNYTELKIKEISA
jgi:large subunit ribosomal protein L21